MTRCSTVFLAILLTGMLTMLAGSVGAQVQIQGTADYYCYGSNEQTINQYISVIRDPQAKITLADIEAGTVKLESANIDALHFGSTNDVIWLHLPAFNCQEQYEDYMLLTHNVRVEELKIYAKKSSGMTVLFDTSIEGSTIDILKRYQSIALPFSLESSERVDFYIRYKAHNTAAIPLEIIDENAFAYSLSKEKNTVTAISVALIAVIIFNLVMFVTTRMKVFAFYVLIVITSMGYLLHYIGWTTIHVWGEGIVDHMGAGLISVLSSFAIVQFNRYYFDTQSKSPKLDRWLQAFGWLSLVWCCVKILTVLVPVVAPVVINSLAYTVVYPSFILVITTALYFIIYGEKENGALSHRMTSSLILVAWLVLIVNVVIMGLRFNNIIPQTGVSTAIEFGQGLLAQAIIVSIALSSRIRIISLQREELAEDKMAMMNRQQDLLKEKTLADQSAIETGKLMLSVGHDSQQMLAAIRNYADILQHDSFGEKPNKIGRAVKDSAQTLMDILSSAMDAGDRRSADIYVQPETVSAENLFNALSLIYKQMAQEGNNRLIFKGEQHSFFTDRIVVMRVMGNFISNAIKHTANGKVLVTCRKQNGHILLQVWDSGAGMSDKEMASLFTEPFEMRSHDQQITSDGAGVGLKVCRELAEKVGGKISFDSQKGTGTRASLLLPDMDSQNMTDNFHKVK